jgi:hypothetical protein
MNGCSVKEETGRATKKIGHIFLEKKHIPVLFKHHRDQYGSPSFSSSHSTTPLQVCSRALLKTFLATQTALQLDKTRARRKGFPDDNKRQQKTQKGG